MTLSQLAYPMPPQSPCLRAVTSRLAPGRILTGDSLRWQFCTQNASCLLHVLQGGNNNTYCHDSPLNWIDWQAAEDPSNAFARFFRNLIALRQEHGWQTGHSIIIVMVLLQLTDATHSM